MVTSVASWKGLNLGDFAIEREIARSPFATTYLGIDSKGIQRVFKASSDDPVTVDDIGSNASKAFAMHTGTYSEVSPIGSDVLVAQQATLTKSTAFIQPSAVQRIGSTAYYSMHFVDGASLRSLIDQRKVTPAHLLSVCEAVSQLQADGALHGDLKPDNILFADATRAVLIDPGWHGPMRCAEGSMPTCLITTESYYPTFQPNDLMALGITLWECLIGTHPLNCERSSQMSNDNNFVQAVNMHVVMGRSAAEALLTVPAPVEIGTVDATVSQLIMKLMEIDVSSGVRHWYRGPSVLPQLCEALRR